MTDLQLLFAILGGLYVWECACWVRRGGVTFTTWLGRHWTIRHPSTQFGNQAGGFVFAAPLPPLGTLFTTQQFPFSLGAAGALTFVSATVSPGWRPAQTNRFLTWEQIATLELRGKKLTLQKAVIYTAPSSTGARRLITTLRRLAKLPSPERDLAIQQLLRDGFDSATITAAMQTYQQQTWWLRIFANLLFVLVFVLAPLLVMLVGLKLVWIGLLAAVLGLMFTSAARFAQIHKNLWPEAADERFTQTLIVALSPVTNIRALDLISRPRFETFHPLAVAKHLLPAAEFSRLARRYLLDLQHPVLPVCPNCQPEAVAAEASHRQTLLAIIEDWLATQNISPHELCRPAPPADATCRAYCPRCEAQFTTVDAVCRDCGGRPLVGFGKAD